MSIQIIVNIKETEDCTMSYEIIGSHSDAGATPNEIEIAKRLSGGIRNALLAIKTTNKDKNNAH
ncbi:TPA: hypothetical protein ON750_000165 [Morganella morganii]|nr:hypothetical protein [Morganella morganii]